VGLDQIPLTTNGKADRKRLPAPPRDGFAADSALYVAPGAGIEEQLAAIFGEVLGVDRVGVHSDFFELGGDSLLAVQTLSRVEAAFATSISIRSFFSAPTVAQLARQVEAERGRPGCPIESLVRRPKFDAIRGYRHREPPVRNRGDSKEMSSVVSPLPTAAAASRVSQAMTEAVYIFPPSFGQQQLWLLDRLLPDGSVYNVPAVVRLIGALDIEALQEALRELVRRHEVLRTRFEVEHAMPVQVIAPELKLALEGEDVGALSAG